MANETGARDPLTFPNRAPGSSPGYPGLSRLRSMRPLLEAREIAVTPVGFVSMMFWGGGGAAVESSAGGGYQMLHHHHHANG